MGNYFKQGSWSAICDICGFEYKSDQLRKNWKGLYVCSRDYEPRHPQDYLRARKERVSPPWVRPEAEDDFIDVCTLWGTSAYADLATADCSQADNTEYTYLFLYNLKNGL